jgi:hypothetical protein
MVPRAKARYVVPAERDVGRAELDEDRCGTPTESLSLNGSFQGFQCQQPPGSPQIRSFARRFSQLYWIEHDFEKPLRTQENGESEARSPRNYCLERKSIHSVAAIRFERSKTWSTNSAEFPT